MRYFITNQIEMLQETYSVFESSYRRFLGERTGSMFQEILNHSVCASLIYQDEKLHSFCFHRELICQNWKNPPSYMADTSKEFLQFIEGRFNILTVEWLTVAPEFLGKFSKVQPADLMVGCALKFMANSWCNASMGFSRQDTKTDLITMRFGSRSFGTVMRFDLPCSVVFMEDFNLKSHPILPTQKKIDELWKNRINHLPSLERKVAA